MDGMGKVCKIVWVMGKGVWCRLDEIVWWEFIKVY